MDNPPFPGRPTAWSAGRGLYGVRFQTRLNPTGTETASLGLSFCDFWFDPMLVILRRSSGSQKPCAPIPHPLSSSIIFPGNFRHSSHEILNVLLLVLLSSLQRSSFSSFLYSVFLDVNSHPTQPACILSELSLTLRRQAPVPVNLVNPSLHQPTSNLKHFYLKYFAFYQKLLWAFPSWCSRNESDQYP